MTLIECTYQTLKQAKLTTTREAFSKHYVGRSRSWFAYTAHMERDFSVGAAVQCLRSIRLQRQRGTALNKEQHVALSSAETQLLQHLNERHLVADVCA